MKVTIKNIGVLKDAKYELADFNIICGENNSGKTYAMYALYGFLDFWRKAQLIDYRTLFNLSDTNIKEIFSSTGFLTISLDSLNLDTINKTLSKACQQFYSKSAIKNIFAGQENYFIDAIFEIQITSDEIRFLDEYEKKMHAPNGEQVLQIIKESRRKTGRNELTISLLLEDKTTINYYGIHQLINIAVREIMFDTIFPEVFIACAERTGAVIFNEELDIQKNALLNVSEDVLNNPQSLFNAIYQMKYPLPVRRNIDFIRRLKNVTKEDSYLAKEYPHILKFFDNEIVKGKYKVDNASGIVWFIPKQKSLDNKVVKLTLNEASSSTRALLDISFYLHYLAKPGQLLMIDEPELNLHPNNQRKMARLLSMLVNIGIKVFITTHSDYIIKELNTLIMLLGDDNKEHVQNIMKKFNYTDNELITSDKVKVYIAKQEKLLISETVSINSSKKVLAQTLVPAKIDSFYGIEAESFDKTIVEMNNIQQEIIFGK